MKTHSLVQGSPEWKAYRATHFNASDAPAMLGISPYKTRIQLLHELHTGAAPEVDAATQRRFDAGHAAEKAARPLAEEILGEDLYPVTGSVGELSASFDGLTMDESIVWEHKLMNIDLAESLASGVIPDSYHPQLEQQLLVSGADKALFMATSADKTAMEHVWYTSNPDMRQRLIAGWQQFAKDLAAYVPPVVTVTPVAKTAANLPVVFDMRVEGKLVSCNLEQYKPAALAYIAAINTELVTDQNFADADADAKFCRASADKLDLAIEQVLGQMGDINQALNTVREISAAFNGKGLALEKLVKAEKENRRIKIVSDAVAELNLHFSALNHRTRNHMPIVQNDFNGVIKGLKSIDSMRDKVSGELARCKIESNAIADRIQYHMELLDDEVEFGFLFPDSRQIVHKASDDFKALVASRIAAHKAAEAKREEEQRARIRAEEQARAEREHAAKVESERIQREQAERAQAARIRDEHAAFEKLERDETARLANLNTTMIVEAAPVVLSAKADADRNANAFIDRIEQQMPATVRQAMAPKPASAPTMSLGEISTRLGFNVTSVFLASLGFETTTVKAAKLFQESDFLPICRALIEHIESVCELQPA